MCLSMCRRCPCRRSARCVANSTPTRALSPASDVQAGQSAQLEAAEAEYEEST
jgi:hypothetical protein